MGKDPPLQDDSSGSRKGPGDGGDRRQRASRRRRLRARLGIWDVVAPDRSLEAGRLRAVKGSQTVALDGWGRPWLR